MIPRGQLSVCYHDSYVKGFAFSLQINWWKTKSLLDGRTHPKEVNILRFSGQRNSGMVPSLDAFSEYHLTVLAYNSKGAGPESEAYIFQTPEGGERINVEGAIYADYVMALLNIPFIIDS